MSAPSIPKPVYLQVNCKIVAVLIDEDIKSLNNALIRDHNKIDLYCNRGSVSDLMNLPSEFDKKKMEIAEKYIGQGKLDRLSNVVFVMKESEQCQLV